MNPFLSILGLIGIASPGIVHWPAGITVKPGSIINRPAHLIDSLD
jgi:hypothetical protein